MRLPTNNDLAALMANRRTRPAGGGFSRCGKTVRAGCMSLISHCAHGRDHAHNTAQRNESLAGWKRYNRDIGRAISNRSNFATDGRDTGRLGKTLLATKPVANGTSSVATGTLVIHGTALPPGAYTLTVYYGGDSNYLTSAAITNLPFLAPAAAPTTALKIPASALQGQNVTLQATVTATTGIPAGTVTFEDGSTTLGSAPLYSIGNASISLSNLGFGSHSVAALFSPTDSTQYEASQSQATTIFDYYIRQPCQPGHLALPVKKQYYSTVSITIGISRAYSHLRLIVHGFR